jgi:hypothetical protein
MLTYISIPKLTINFMGASLFDNGTSISRVYLGVNDIQDYGDMEGIRKEAIASCGKPR